MLQPRCFFSTYEFLSRPTYDQLTIILYLVNSFAFLSRCFFFVTCTREFFIFTHVKKTLSRDLLFMDNLFFSSKDPNSDQKHIKLVEFGRNLLNKEDNKSLRPNNTSKCACIVPFPLSFSHHTHSRAKSSKSLYHRNDILSGRED